MEYGKMRNTLDIFQDIYQDIGFASYEVSGKINSYDIYEAEDCGNNKQPCKEALTEAERRKNTETKSSKKALNDFLEFLEDVGGTPCVIYTSDCGGTNMP